MRTNKLISCALVLGMASVPVLADMFDTSKPFLCASMDVYECIDGGECKMVNAETIDAPEFLRVNLKRKAIFSSRNATPTEIEHIEDVESRVVMHGTEDGVSETGDGVGWTLSIDKRTGRMVATAAGIEAAFVIFGACTTL